MHSSLHRSDINDAIALRVQGRADMGAQEGQYGFTWGRMSSREQAVMGLDSRSVSARYYF